MSCTNINRDLAAASNLVIGGNPSYTLEDFKAQYPQFGVVPDSFLKMYIGLACSSLQKNRFGEAWELAVGWYVAHYATLYLEGMAPSGASSEQTLAKGRAKGVAASKSVDGVSVSYDTGSVANDLARGGAFKLTIFGQQLLTIALKLGAGGTYVV